jgi:hypothetical protein
VALRRGRHSGIENNRAGIGREGSDRRRHRRGAIDESGHGEDRRVGAGPDLIYVSHGAAGVYAVEVEGDALEDVTEDKDLALKPLGKLRFEGLESVNHVAFDGSILVIATGRGGVKIVSVKANKVVEVQATINTDIE